MHEPDPNPLVDGRDIDRVRIVVIFTIAAAFLVGAGVAVAFHAFGPEYGWGAAIGVGAMVGFWTCPLFGAVVGNGLHEFRLEKAGEGH